jgi:nicotinamide riboside kinase
MKTKIINLVAGPSSGKSLVAALLFAELKMMHYKAEYIQEYVKTLIWQKRFDEINNQYNVSIQQYKMIKAVDGQVDFAVCDSPLLLGLYYNKSFDTNVSNIEKTDLMIKNKMQEFDNVYIFLERNSEYPYEIEGRIHSEEQSKIIDKELLNILEEMKLPYKKFVSDRRNIPAIIDYIMEFSQN